MTRFAVYFIPEEGAFYQAGSSVVGYDIRNQRTLPQPGFTKPEWAPDGGQFGFHATITDAIDVGDDQLDAISARLTELLGCFRPENEYVLQVDRVGFWRGSSNEAVLIMKPNRNVEMLHDVLVTDLHARGIGSAYTRKYQADPATFEPSSATDIQRVKSFLSPYIFDDFVPHFTCLGAFPGSAEERTNVEIRLRETFAGVEMLTINTLALVVQRDGEDHFSIYKEFNLHDGRSSSR
jgi:hypothetical protein